MTCLGCEHNKTYPFGLVTVESRSYCMHPEILSRPLATRRLNPCIPNPADCPLGQAIRAALRRGEVPSPSSLEPTHAPI